MSLTPSTMLPLGTIAPSFELLDTVSGYRLSYEDIKGEKGTVVMFICNHCPYVIHVNEEIVRLANDYRVTGFGFVAISSNDVVKYPQDGPEFMEQVADKNDYPFPYLYDATQEVAKAYDAACTPDFYVFDNEDQLVYRGQLDDSRPKNGIPLTGRSIREALDALLGNKQVPENQKPSMGCGIKWKMQQ
ncbi:alkyl hydroperoxide reductase [Nonlabens sp. YIK11]|uniref:thioredoxin family protein n=1 Tax=Nonlabens sp. YIK11 TaxID=1453349 RepID=UPI0006DCD456|nr:thioredoxin family protein [Nonlabens sp. YIK11]KQC34351.1 alkyl hydroperoxide reductase [Nonlabens sp. YIK11]